MRDYAKLYPWQEEPTAGVLDEPGSSRYYETGSWRTYRPVWDPEKCTHCLRCWAYCPDASVLVENGKVTGVDYLHCKGCGICARECPAKEKAIEMVLESDARQKERQPATKEIKLETKSS